MQLEHFIYGLFPKVGYKTIFSSRCKELLDEKELVYLQHIGDRLTKPSYVIWFPRPELFTVSYINFKEDDFGRQAIWNHTIICEIKDFMQYVNPISIFKPFFLTEFNESTLKAIEVNECPSQNGS